MGVEPTLDLRPNLISNQALSATQPPLRNFVATNVCRADGHQVKPPDLRGLEPLNPDAPDPLLVLEHPRQLVVLQGRRGANVEATRISPSAKDRSYSSWETLVPERASASTTSATVESFSSNKRVTRCRAMGSPRSSKRRRRVNATRPRTVTKTATTYIPAPAVMPSAATSHRLAAVVSPRTVMPVQRIAPAPRKPIPETTDAAMREASTSTRSPGT